MWGQWGTHSDLMASAKKCKMAGPLKSSYMPALALSLIVMTPNFAGSPRESALPPLRGALCGAASGILQSGEP